MAAEMKCMDTLETVDVGSERKAAGAVTVKPVANAIRILRHLSQNGAPERSVDVPAGSRSTPVPVSTSCAPW